MQSKAQTPQAPTDTTHGKPAGFSRHHRNPLSTAEEARLRSFAAEIDRIGREAKAKVGQEDLDYIRRVDRVSNGLGIAGRLLIHLSPGPISFGAGVISLWLFKQLQATEIGHTALHGAFNRIEGAEYYHSTKYRWFAPIDEETWRAGHNGKHHGLTNVAGVDPDIHFGQVRLTPEVPHRFSHYYQVLSTFAIAPHFGFVMNAHFTGLVDLYVGNGREEDDFLPDRSWKSIFTAHWQAFRKYIPYYSREYLLFPLLAGPMFWKVVLGNWMSEKLRDVYTAATIFCGHVGEDTASYPEGTRPRSRGERYAMQVEASNNFEVSLPISMLCGALDLQIEHHLYPTLPTNRLREIAPQVKAACEAHGVQYRTDTWPRTLWKVLRRLVQLSVPTAKERAARLAPEAT